MTRTGGVILAVLVLAGVALASIVRITGPGTPRTGSTTPVAANVPATPPGPLIVPVAGVATAALTDSFDDPRGDGSRRHGAIDIMAPVGAPVVAAADGRIEKLFTSDLGGLTVYERSPDGGTVYYYAHLSRYAPTLAEGQAVRAGQPIGFVGDTGDAGAGNYHLHFGMQRMRADERWWQGQDVNPYPLLAGGGEPG